eukprot:scaffold54830_cov84-Phaeocystis_antarctica.AAC.1
MSVAPHCTTTHIYGGPGVGRLHGVWGRWRVGGRKTLDVSLLLYITGGAQVTRWVSQYGIKVSSWGSETFKIVIPVENHTRNRKSGWIIITPSGVGGVNQRINIWSYHICHDICTQRSGKQRTSP